jgi:hypothetical protein
LEYFRITLELPDEYVPYDLVGGQVRWLFKGSLRHKAEELLVSLGLSQQQRQLLANAAWEETPLGAVLNPPRELILQMSPATRAALYSYLGQFPENLAQAQAFRFRTDKRDEWLGQSNLSTSTMALVESLFYQLGGTTLFADAETVLPFLGDASERRALYKMLARKSALLVRLRLPAASEVAAWAGYWSIGGRAKDIEPLLLSLSRNPQGGTIDIMHLLPRHARARINTYPVPTDSGLLTPWDCHWSSLNFFRNSPDDSFATTAGATREIQEHYSPVLANPKLGDLLLFFDDRGGTFHSCVYVADEIVFTKNGPSAMAPWVLMTLPDVLAAYENGHPIQVRVYRRNNT